MFKLVQLGPHNTGPPHPDMFIPTGILSCIRVTSHLNEQLMLKFWRNNETLLYNKLVQDSFVTKFSGRKEK